MNTQPARLPKDDRFVGIWTFDEGYQVTELLFRSDGRYQLDTKSTGSSLSYSSTERGLYEMKDSRLTLTSYEFLGDNEGRAYDFKIAGTTLSLARVDFEIQQVYQLKSGSKSAVLAREKVRPDLVRAWRRRIEYYGDAEYTFRPDGCYFLKNTPEDSQFPPEFIRGRYRQDGTLLTIQPYSGVESRFELDFFGDALTLIRKDEFFGESTTYFDVPGSSALVRTKAAESAAFLKRENWHVGTWEIRGGVQTIDVTFRPDGRYIAKNDTDFLRGIVRGKYTLEPGRMKLSPFIGQDLYARSNGEFGKVERTRAIDYYDGELQFIDLEAISQSVLLARKKPGSDAAVIDKVRQAQAERAREGWYIGAWEVNDPAGWMEFTWRPDGRYIAKSGAGGVPSQVERGQYRVAPEKITLAPYAGLGPARGFELDLYDGDWFLIGDSSRMVVARKIAGSEAGVVEKTRSPESMKGERGSILGLWSANTPGQHVELVFRQDGEFRLSRCAGGILSRDYGLYSVDMSARTLASDSRFVDVQNLGLDFYGNTLTIFGGSLGPPSTYAVNPGTVDAAIQASLKADADEAKIDAQWTARIAIAARDPKAVQASAGTLPVDRNPGHVFDKPTVFGTFQFYRRLIPGFAYFNVNGSIKTVPVTNSREWYFFPTGRVLVRFQNYRAGAVYPSTVAETSDSWAAYRIEPKPAARDILHVYADNGLFLEADMGETIEMTLEDGRRNLFWGKDYQLQSEWAGEQKSIPCSLPANPNPGLMNTGLALSTAIKPDPIPLEAHAG